MLPCIAVPAYSNKGRKQVIRLHRTMSMFVIKATRQSPGYERLESLSRKSSCVNYLEASSSSVYKHTHTSFLSFSCSEFDVNAHIYPTDGIAHCSMNFLFIYDRPLRKLFLHTVQSNTSPFNWQYPCVSLWSSSSCLHLLSRVHIISILSYIFPSISYFGRKFLRSTRAIQWIFPLLLYAEYSSPPWPYVILLFSHCRSKWYSPSFSRNTFQNFPATSALLSKCLNSAP